jgi:DNA polymerase I-like protein with 3'-5' exonuclease and polymerase domains
MRDNGGDMAASKGARFSLDASCYRHLEKRYWDHKKEAHDWILKNVKVSSVKRRELKRGGWRRTVFSVKQVAPSKSKVGAYIKELPYDLLVRYNCADTENTHRLYHILTSWFNENSLDWQLDHSLYIPICHKIVASKMRGIATNVAKLEAYVPHVVKEVADLDKTFLDKYSEVLPVPFNFNSTKSLEELFVQRLQIKPLIMTTPKNKHAIPKPSFRAAHMKQWGEGGLLLQNRKKLLKRIEHAEKAIEVAGYDGRWHPELKSTGTRTGRFAGGGGFNVQAVPRRNKAIMSSFVTDKGKVLSSQDLIAAEPTATCQYSKDANYYDACFGMVGQAPFWKDGVLRIDDIYLMFASVIPPWRAKLEELYHRTTFDEGRNFVQQWSHDSEVIKAACKSFRGLAKILVLGVGYGMGGKKLAKTFRENGINFPVAEVKMYWNMYWELFNGLKFLNEQCVGLVERQGYIQNEFGYINWPPSPHKAMNALIQSTISGVMNLYTNDLLQRAPYAEFITIIHDELIVQIPDGMQEDYAAKQKETLEIVNDFVKWDVPVRAGLNWGTNLYECK